jgi:Rne/Rng family ribonuclease
MLKKVDILVCGLQIETFAYDQTGSLLFHVIDNLHSNLESIYKARINSLNKKSKIAYIDFLPNMQGIVNLKDIATQPGNHLICQMVWGGDDKKLPKFSEDIKIFGKYVIVLPNDHRHFFSKKLKNKDLLSGLSNKYANLGLIFRSSIDDLTDYDLLIAEIELLAGHQNTAKAWQEAGVGVLVAVSGYKFMQLLREAQLAPNIEVTTNNQEIFDRVMPYLDIWQLYSIRLDQAIKIEVWEVQDKQHAEFSLEVHKLSGINLIDINSKNAPLNFYQVNYLAIDEIIRQIWRHDMTGIILLDFIKNMSAHQEQQLVTRLTEQLTFDWRQHQVLGFTKAGICEIIRNK